MSQVWLLLKELKAFKALDYYKGLELSCFKVPGSHCALTTFFNDRVYMFFVSDPGYCWWLIVDMNFILLLNVPKPFL